MRMRSVATVKVKGYRPEVTIAGKGAGWDFSF
jgi:hypothetical protein